jgi:hypothetical protein
MWPRNCARRIATAAFRKSLIFRSASFAAGNTKIPVTFPSSVS